ncbi:hypothetical protein Fmac_016182 [Flemingia macrophylla]|uniref:Uncharacterized protein n=1 Tax=Flemingia macrophylla TaxID=520843 RepID=A0ABD1MGU3_9FABA
MSASVEITNIKLTPLEFIGASFKLYPNLTRVAYLPLMGESSNKDFLNTPRLKFETLLKRYQAVYHLNQSY